MKRLSASLTALALVSALIMGATFARILTAIASEQDAKTAVPAELKSEKNENQNFLTTYSQSQAVGYVVGNCKTQEKPEVIGVLVDIDGDFMPDAVVAFRQWDDGIEEKPFAVFVFKTATLFVDENRDGKIDKQYRDAITRNVCLDVPKEKLP